MSAIRNDRDERASTRERRGRADEDDGYEADYSDEDDYEPEDDYEADYDEDQDEDQDEDEPAPERQSKDAKVSAMEAGEAGLRHISAIVTKNVEVVTAVRPTDDGWTVEIELLDARHIPSSSDTLALYEVDIDAAGELMSYRRTAMYSRARGREAR
jgi:hypothetical protein